MALKINTLSQNKIEIYNDSLRDSNIIWEDFKANFFYSKFLLHNEVTFISQLIENNSLLFELGKPKLIKEESVKFLILSRSEITKQECQSIAIDDETFIHGFYIILNDSQELQKKNFYKHLFSKDIFYHFTNLEYIYISHDDEMINWINPSNAEKILSNLEINSLTKHV